MQRQYIVSLIGGLFLLALGGCVDPTPQVTEREVIITATPAKLSHLEDLKQRGFTYLGYFSERPYAYVDETGDFKGVDVDISREAMECVGIPEVRPVPVRWEGLVPGVLSKRFDAITTGMTVLPEREEAMIHSQPLWYFTSIAVVRKGNPKDIHSVLDIADKGAKFGCIQATIECQTAGEAGVSQDQIQVFGQIPEAISALRAGRIDVYMGAEISLRLLLKSSPDVAKEVEIPEPWEYFRRPVTAHWFHPDHVELRDAYDKCLTTLKRDGTVKEIAEKYDFPSEVMVPPPED